MYYSVSDIHGHYEEYMALLEKLCLKDSDTLFVLGDVIDRGKHGLKILLEMAERPNIVMLMGNHEAAALVCLPLLIKLSESELTSDETEALKDWFSDGGDTTVAEFLSLSSEDKIKVLEILRGMPAYKEVEAGQRNYVLVHAGLGNFSPEKALSDYFLEELIFERPNMSCEYFHDKYIVFGHTPTRILRGELPDNAADKDDIYIRGKLIGIDCGCGNVKLGCVCLDTMEQVYV